MKQTTITQITRTLALALTLLITKVSADEATKAILVDNTSPELRHVASRFWSVVFSPDGATLAITAGWDSPKEPGELVLWDVVKQQTTLIWRQDVPIRCVAFSSDGARIAIGDFKGSTQILEPKTGETILSLPKQQKLVNSVAFMPNDGKLATGGFDENVSFWDAASGKLLDSFNLPGEGITTIAISPDGSRLAATTWPGKVHVWDVLKMTELYAVDANENAGIAEVVAFSPDGKSLVTGSWDTSLKIWNVDNGKVLLDLPGHETPVQNAVFSPDGQMLASSDAVGNVRLWDLASGKTIAVFQAHEDRCFGLSFSPDGKLLATASWDRKVKIWDVKTIQQLATLPKE